MREINLEALKGSDIPIILDAVHRFFMANGFTTVTENIFLKPENLSKRWELTISCLNNWRLTGGGPNYMKTGPGPKAQVRYPMLGKSGILDFEQRRSFSSTAHESAFIKLREKQVISID